MEKYRKRIVDKLLEKKLKGKGAVLIQGAKWCGKTTTAEQISKSILYMAKPEDKSQNLILADINPSALLEGDTPRLIDEWQIAPKLWDAIRFEVDHRNTEGNFNSLSIISYKCPESICEIYMPLGEGMEQRVRGGVV